MIRSARRSRRGMVLLAVMLVVVFATLVGTTLLLSTSVEASAAAFSVRRCQARAAAWSGVQAVMAELAAQREGILRGEAPEVSKSGTLGMAEGSEWVFRVIPADVGGREVLVAAEGGRLCVNTATAESLERLGVSPAAAAQIVAERGARPFSSVHELLGIRGFSPTPMGPSGGVGMAEEAGGGDAGAAGRSLLDLLTVFSFDPQVQAGLGERGAESAGLRRINLNREWTEELGRAIERRYDRGTADGVRNVMQSGSTFASSADIVRKLRALGAEPSEWAEIMDVFNATPDDFRVGLVDVMSAPEGVLACVPGISEEGAAEIVFQRGRLDGQKRASPVWLVTEGVLTADEFERAVDWVTVRSLQWRVVVEAGRVGRRLDEEQEDQALLDRVVVEAVIDIGARRAQVAYLRDVTHAELAARLEEAGRVAAAEEDGDESPDGGLSSPGFEPPALDTADLETARLRTPSLDLSRSRGPRGVAEGEAGPGAAPAAGAAIPSGEDRRIGRWRHGTGGRRE